MNTYTIERSDEGMQSTQPHPLTARPYRMKRLDDYCRRMSSDRDFVQYDPNVAAVLKEQGYRWDETPRSIYRVDKLYEALHKYDPGRIPDVQFTPEVNHGIALARACFSRPKDEPKLRPLPLTMDVVIELTSNPTGSSGLTAWGVKKEDAMLRGLERGEQTLLQEKAPEPCIAFTRTQFNEKTRLVWGYPYSMTILEGLVARPLIQRFKGSSLTPMAFGMSTHKMGSKLRTAARHNRYAYSIDMSSFDSSICARLIRISFGILKTWFDLEQCEPTTGVSYGKLFDIVENYFIHTPIVMPDHKIYLGKRHGVPSGSYFTQMIDSIANVIIGGTISAYFHMNVDKHDIFVLGDDLLLWSDRNVDLVKLANYASDLYGVEFNPSKSERFMWNEPVKYLGRLWDKGIPDQGVDQIIARMVYPERFRTYSKEPEKKEREVKLLLAAFASTYKSANHILKLAVGTKGVVIAPNADDVHVFVDNLDVDPDHLSGLQRYKMIYLRETTKYKVPASIVSMWVK